MMGKNEFLKLGEKTWVYINVLSLVVIIALMLGGMGTKYWVRQGRDQDIWEGGILRCSKGKWENQHYGEIAQEICDVEGTYFTGLCNLFEDLKAAGVFFLVFELLSLLVTLVWFVNCIYKSQGKQLLWGWLQYFIPVLGFLLHVLGIVVWAFIAKSGFGVDCEDIVEDGERGDLCSTDGPIISVCVAVIYFLVGGVYTYLSLKVWNFKSEQELPNLESVRVPAGGQFGDLEESGENRA